jgi:hypothetical protein
MRRSIGEMPQLTVLSRISNGQPPTSPVLHSNSNCRRSPFWEPKHKHCALRTALARACCETPNRKWRARDSLYHSPTHLRGVFPPQAVSHPIYHGYAALAACLLACAWHTIHLRICRGWYLTRTSETALSCVRLCFSFGVVLIWRLLKRSARSK